MSMPQIHQRLMKNGWIKVTKGFFPVLTLPGNSRLRIRRGGQGKAILAARTESVDQVKLDPVIQLNEGDHYKVDLRVST